MFQVEEPCDGGAGPYPVEQASETAHGIHLAAEVDCYWTATAVDNFTNIFLYQECNFFYISQIITLGLAMGLRNFR